MNGNLVSRFIAVILAGTLTCSLCGCSSSGGQRGSTANGTASQQDSVATATVARGSLTPVSSSNDVVQTAALFVISSAEGGWFRADVRIGDYVKAGAAIGWVNGTTVTTPVDGVIEAIAAANDVAAHYPLFAMRYGGMSSTVDASALLAAVGQDAALLGRFQVRDGQGPTDCAAVVETAVNVLQGEGVSSDDSSAGTAAYEAGATVRMIHAGVADDAGNSTDGEETDGVDAGILDDGTSADSVSGNDVVPQSSSSMMQCLFPKTTSARPGQSVTTVLRTQQITDALLLPITAVAGRSGKGQVLRKTDDGFETVAVKLGASDGSSVVILDGLQEGDEVSATAPNLVPQSGT